MVVMLVVLVAVLAIGLLAVLVPADWVQRGRGSMEVAIPLLTQTVVGIREEVEVLVAPPILLRLGQDLLVRLLGQVLRTRLVGVDRILSQVLQILGMGGLVAELVVRELL
jgi:hypothetical protein